VFDFLDAAVVGILGGIGFAHDDRTYLSNGLYLGYNDDPWLNQEITAGVILIVSV
jgi:hypothetical protein